MRFSDNELKAVSQAMTRPSIIKFSSKITYLKFYSNLPWANELKPLLLGTASGSGSTTNSPPIALLENCYWQAVTELFICQLTHATLYKIHYDKHHINYIIFATMVSIHDDVIKWKHFSRNWPFVRGIHQSPVNSPHKGQWRGALMFSLICVWINDWVNNRKTGDLRPLWRQCNEQHWLVSVDHVSTDLSNI